MTEATPFLRNTILLSHDTRSLAGGYLFLYKKQNSVTSATLFSLNLINLSYALLPFCGAFATREDECLFFVNYPSIALILHCKLRII